MNEMNGFNPNTPVCQCCGMPMNSPDLYGKNADGTPNPEYCHYCCPSGEENMSGTLEEMIECCVPIEMKLGLHPDEQTARERISAYLPTLRYWKNRK